VNPNKLKQSKIPVDPPLISDPKQFAGLDASYDVAHELNEMCGVTIYLRGLSFFFIFHMESIITLSSKSSLLFSDFIQISL
jgi:hypothetical protein